VRSRTCPSSACKNYLLLDSPAAGVEAVGEMVMVARAKVELDPSCFLFFGQSLAICSFCPHSKQRPFTWRHLRSSGRSLPSVPRNFLYAASFFGFVLEELLALDKDRLLLLEDAVCWFESVELLLPVRFFFRLLLESLDFFSEGFLLSSDVRVGLLSS